MKTSAAPEVENLREQVRQLRDSVAHLEDRLAELSPETEVENEDQWGIWPYCYVVASWEFAGRCFHWFHKNAAKRALAWRNRRTQRATEGQEFVGLRLT